MLKKVYQNKSLLKSRNIKIPQISGYVIANLYSIDSSNKVEIEVYVPSRVETYVTQVDKSQLGLYSPKNLQKMQRLRGLQRSKFMAKSKSESPKIFENNENKQLLRLFNQAIVSIAPRNIINATSSLIDKSTSMSIQTQHQN